MLGRQVFSGGAAWLALDSTGERAVHNLESAGQCLVPPAYEDIIQRDLIDEFMVSRYP